jgi:hypothetical protein
MCTLALFALFIAAVLISRRLAQLIGLAVIILFALTGDRPRRAAAASTRASDLERLSSGIHEQPDQRHLRAVGDHAVPRVPVADWELPRRIQLLTSLAHVRRERLVNDDHDARLCGDHDPRPDKMSGCFNDLTVVICTRSGRFGAIMRGANKFKASEVKRAIRSVTQAGLAVEGIRIGRDGAIEVMVARDGTAPAATANEWDDVARQ